MNIKVFDKDNKFVGFTTVDRANNFVKRGVGKMRNDDTVDITFQPSGYSGIANDEIEKYKIPDECVVCGHTDDDPESDYTELVAIAIMAPELKNKIGHLVEKRGSANFFWKINMCDHCSSEFKKIQHKHKMDLFEKHGVKCDTKVAGAAYMAKGLLSRKKPDFIPRKGDISTEELYKIKIPAIEKAVKIKIETDDDLRKVAKMTQWSVHGEQIADADMYLLKKYEDTLKEFEAEWIKLFIDKMKPRHLPLLFTKRYNEMTSNV